MSSRSETVAVDRGEDQIRAITTTGQPPASSGKGRVTGRRRSGQTVMILALSLISIVGTLLLCTVAAFVFARYEFFGRKVLFAIVALLLMVPGISSLIPLFVLMRDLGILNTRLVLVLPHVAGGAVLGTLLMKTFVE